MIRIGNVEEAIEKGMFQEKEIVILGAGKDGKEACVTLLAHHASVKCFMDSNAKGKKPSYYGIPVVPEEDAVITPSDVVLLCIGTFSSMCDQEIVAHPFIQRTGTTSTQLVVFDRMRKDFDVLKAIAQKHQIDLGAAVLDFQGVRMPNYLKMDVGIQRSFIGESCDLILPTMFNEWSAVDEGPYEINEMHLSPQGGDNIIDCGANIGVFSAIAASIPGNMVYAVEPVPHAVKILRNVCELYPNIQICSVALSDTSGVCHMTNVDELALNRMTTKAGDATIEVPMMTVDEMVVKYHISNVDFIKADIEGAERKMLKGATRTLKEHAPKLALCTYHLDDDPEVLEYLIKEANPDYRVIQKKRKLYAYVK